MAPTMQKTQTAFKELKTSMGWKVFTADVNANHSKSMKLLEDNGLRPLTRQEALVIVDQNPELKQQLKGKWFYLAGKGAEESGYHTFNRKGNLTEGKGDIEKTVYVYRGFSPLSLIVHEDDVARNLVRRFVLYAYVDPSDAAPVVLGIRAGHEVAAPKIEVAPAAPESITLTGVSIEALKELHRASADELEAVSGVFGPESLPNTRKLVDALRIKE